MCLYEVNIAVHPDTYDAYVKWLKPHIKEILSLPGFVWARAWQETGTFAPDDDPTWPRLTVHYYLKSYDDLKTYLNVHAPRLRGDAEKNFAGRFRAHRRIFPKLIYDTETLTFNEEYSQVKAIRAKENNVAPQVNWEKLKDELNKIANVERLKSEVQRISHEIKKFDINARLSPTARERLKTMESKYFEISKTITRTQRQVDREFNRVLRNLKDQRQKAEKGLDFVLQTAQEQRRRLEKAGKDIKSRVLEATGRKPKKKKKSAPRKKTRTATTA